MITTDNRRRVSPGRGRTSIANLKHCTNFEYGDDGPGIGPDQKGGDAAKGGSGMAVSGSWTAMPNVRRSCIIELALLLFTQMPVGECGHAAMLGDQMVDRNKLLATRQSFSVGGAGE